ncbi:MAG: MBL fold metallo-hydrolase [Phycisphaerae bacterium]|nr:MBL fold metallo-hydrolase [Phycisphaerae bacterium]|tara:strand:+ start:973 stop:2388 length:1416 start_codon:yes stop_codon:yes gene_type:complete
MLFRLIYDEALAHASYLIGCQRSREAIVFDPARDVDRYMGLAASHGLRITATAETHIHADFLSGCGELARRCGAHVYLSGEGGPEWESSWVKDYSHTLLSDGDHFELGGLRFRALHTPGHTPEHMMYEVIDQPSGPDPLGLITGDFVFVGALGRPDLLETAMGQAGIQEACAKSLHASAARFLDMPDFLQVWPAHGSGSACGKALGSVPQSTVGYERRTNRSLAFVGNENEFVEDILSGQTAPPLYFERMKRLNRDGVPPLQLTGPPVLTAEECKALDLDEVVVIDTRPWELFRQSHLRNAHWSAPGAWFPASVGSYVEPEQSVALLVEPDEAEHYLRLMIRIGLDRIVGMITPGTFKEAASQCETHEAQEIDAGAFQTAIEAGNTRILDVRGGDEYERGSVPGSCHVPYTRLAKHIDELPPVNDEPLLVHCQGGLRSAMALTYLKRLGYNPVNIAGGYAAWARLGHQQRA